jgi:hypothetical protein
MAIETCLTNLGRLNFLKGRIKPEHVFRVALYTSAANLGKKTKVKVSAGEVSVQGYMPLRLAEPVFSINENDEAVMDFPGDVKWDNVSITARGCLIYDETLDNLAVAVGDFGQDVSSTNDTFTLIPSADLIRFR